jgi:hypothetical protein
MRVSSGMGSLHNAVYLKKVAAQFLAGVVGIYAFKDSLAAP